jgi:thioredoxin reductase (NADPH)
MMEPAVEFSDVVIIGAGPSGLATAIEAQRQGLRSVVLDKGCITNSIFNFPSQMVFFTTPELLEIGGLPLVSDREKPSRNEALKYYRKVATALRLDVRQYQEVLQIQQVVPGRFRISTTSAVYESSSVVLAIGYYDNPNLLGIPGENLPHVSHYYTEPYSFYGRDVVVIGGKNSAAEAALDLYRGGARVSVVHRGAELGSTVKYWVRPDIENRFKAGEITPYLNSRVLEITRMGVRIEGNGAAKEIPAHQVFVMTGYCTSTKFFEQLGVHVDPASLRPQYNSQTHETNVPGVYVAGSAVAGRMNGEVFIENGRLHGVLVAQAIAKKTGA